MIGIVYGALVAMVQPDMKKLVAYSSVSHLGFVVLGICAMNVNGIVTLRGRASIHDNDGTAATDAAKAAFGSAVEIWSYGTNVTRLTIRDDASIRGNTADAGGATTLTGVGTVIHYAAPGTTASTVADSAAMALRTWGVLRTAPIHAYLSLALVAQAQVGPEIPVIADARRDSWHVFTRAAGLRRVPAAELSGDFLTPAGFRHWSPLPAGQRRAGAGLSG